jgi:hypothetical protein
MHRLLLQTIQSKTRAAPGISGNEGKAVVRAGSKMYPSGNQKGQSFVSMVEKYCETAYVGSGEEKKSIPWSAALLFI